MTAAHYTHSTLRERIAEHVFVGDALRTLWRLGIHDVEVLRSEFDAHGYDLVMARGPIVRHIQFKTGTARRPSKVSLARVLAEKPSGCAIWMRLDQELNRGRISGSAVRRAGRCRRSTATPTRCARPATRRACGWCGRTITRFPARPSCSATALWRCWRICSAISEKRRPMRRADRVLVPLRFAGDALAGARLVSSPRAKTEPGFDPKSRALLVWTRPRGQRNRMNELQERIETAYAASGNDLGWRFLYSPAAVLERADVAFLGLNPGGSERPSDHAKFCMAGGSAYAEESWAGFPPGQSPLQRQVLLLFQRLEVRPADVLAGNLVPFRSPNWERLADRQQALRFGRALWADVLEQVRPKLVISMGGVANEAVAAMLSVAGLRSVPVAWGQVSAVAGRFDGGRFVGLPHLSRFGIISRPQSAEALKELFGEQWRGTSSSSARASQ